MALGAPPFVMARKRRAVSGRRPQPRAWWAAPVLAVMIAAAVLLTSTTVHVAELGVTAGKQAGQRVGGPLVIPAPKTAGQLPRRLGPVADRHAAAIVTEFRQRFGAVGGGLLVAAQRAAAAGHGRPARHITAAWTSGLYGEPGHLDPVTYRPSWIMYLGMSATGTLGMPADTIGKLMLGVLGPYSKVGPWRVAAGHRGGAANCTVAWLDHTSVAVCGWASQHTIGALLSPVRETSVQALAALMIRMRYDLQQS